MFKKKQKDEAPASTETPVAPIETGGIEEDMFSDFDDATNIETQTQELLEETYEKPSDKLKKAKKVKKEKQPKAKDEQLEEVEETEEKPEMILYLIVDKQISGLLNYFRESGIKVSNIFDDISDAKNAILMQSEPTRIVIIDTGLGRFTTTNMRAELIDMLGISDEQNRTVVFYTDSVLKVDTLRALKKTQRNIEWLKYQSTSVVAATLLSYNETYKYDMEDADEVLESEKDVLNFKGMSSSAEDGQRLDISGFSAEAIVTHMSTEEGEGLPGFKINL